MNFFQKVKPSATNTVRQEASPANQQQQSAPQPSPSIPTQQTPRPQVPPQQAPRPQVTPQQQSASPRPQFFKQSVETQSTKTYPTTTETIPFINKVDTNNYAVENVGLINDINFSDVYIPHDKKTFIWGGKTNAGLKIVKFDDFEEFFEELEKAYTDTRSYLLNYKGRNYRVERTIALDGPQYIARKMPITVPDIRNLGIPQGIYEHLISLADGCGLIILAGATGSGKSTTVSALLKEYFQQKGGYAYTIEDPIEMPLDGVYKTPLGELGLCKQTTPPDGIWEEGIKSALRSKPRYVYLGEIRSPDIASEALRAATSGHLVI
jgi:twitching motility protein PilT